MRVGIVGAGQLARMLLEAASALGLDVTILAEHPDDAAALTAHNVIIGAPKDPEALAALADVVDVITFDHELVDLELLEELESAGTVRVAPSPAALICAVDKVAMRMHLAGHDLPMPDFLAIEPGSAFSFDDLGGRFGWPMVVKAARGGYDGRGVFVVDNADDARTVINRLHGEGTTALIEEHVAIVSELAALVCRDSAGTIVSWPVVETAQIDGVCREVLVPGNVSDAQRQEGENIALAVADIVKNVGIMAVELFVTEHGLLINELAMRPHNSGHWTQDGSVTSQFENHLRAVAGLPMGAPSMTATHVACINVFGGPDALDPFHSLHDALGVSGAHIHLYGKEPRPGRKLGHVTVTGDDPDEIRHAGWAAAISLGTVMPDELKRETR